MAEPISNSRDELMHEVEVLRAMLADTASELAEAQEVLRAIRSGDVDAVVVSGAQGDQVFTLKGAEYAYRALVEAMNEGAATLDARMGPCSIAISVLRDLLGIPLEQIIGRPASNSLLPKPIAYSSRCSLAL